MTDADIHAAALGDPDARPLTPERLKHMKRTPQVKVIRRALGLSQERSAVSYTAGDPARLGTGSQGARRRRPRLPQSDRAQSVRGERSLAADGVTEGFDARWLAGGWLSLIAKASLCMPTSS